MSSSAPRQYITEPDMREPLALPAVFMQQTRIQREHLLREEPPLPTGTEARLCADVAARQALGLRKYGTTVADNPLTLRQWLQHAYEEALDQAVYLRRSIEELDRPQP